MLAGSQSEAGSRESYDVKNPKGRCDGSGSSALLGANLHGSR
jgi:hypothetical protein